MHYWENESCTYKDGYIDGKYICTELMKKVAEYGSEPARLAFDGSFITFSKIGGLEELLNRITSYPIGRKNENIKSFYAQLQAWKWYYYEAIKHKNEESIEIFYKNVIDFTDWGISEFDWASQFVVDSELNWIDGKVPISDI